MPKIKNLINQYSQLWDEYQDFLIKNKLQTTDVSKVCFIYYDRLFNNNCLKYKPNLTQEECSMYNLTVDDDCNWILTDNGYGTIYVKLKTDTIVGFRCANECMKPINFRFLNQWLVTSSNLSKNHYKLLQELQFL